MSERLVSVIRKGTHAIIEVPFDTIQEGDYFFVDDASYEAVEAPYYRKGIDYDGIMVESDAGIFAPFELESGVKPYEIVMAPIESKLHIPNALHIEGIDALQGMGIVDCELDASVLAAKDGVKFINDMPFVPAGVYIDTPENRDIIAKALEENPKLKASAHQMAFYKAAVELGSVDKAALLAVLSVIDKHGFGITAYEEDGRYCGLEIEDWTPHGVDMPHFLDLRDVDNPTDIFDIKNEMSSFYEEFDVDDEVRIHMEDSRFRNDFTYQQACEEFAGWKETLKDLRDDICRVVDIVAKFGVISKPVADFTLGEMVEYFKKCDETLYFSEEEETVSDAEFDEFLCERMDTFESTAHALLEAIAGCTLDMDLGRNFRLQDAAETILMEAGYEICRPHYLDDGTGRKPCYLTGDCDNGNCRFTHLRNQEGGVK